MLSIRGVSRLLVVLALAVAPSVSAQETRVVTGLVVDADRMRANLESSGGLIYTSTVLLELVESGLSREDAYTFVQAAAMRTWKCCERSRWTPCRAGR